MEDQNNITYTLKLKEIYSPTGKIYHKEKYLPKINMISRYGDINADSKLLDIGVGYGGFLNLVENELDLTTYGLDPYQGSIDITRQYSKADIRLGQIEDASWPFDFLFDVITCFDVIEHLEDPSLFFKHVRKYIKPNGIIIISTPLKLLPYKMRSIPFIGLPDTNHTHINVHHPKYWDLLATQGNFEILEKWRGEHLTHVKIIPGIFRRVCNWLKIDHRKMPVLNTFEQAYNMALKLKIDD